MFLLRRHRVMCQPVGRGWMLAAIHTDTQFLPSCCLPDTKRTLPGSLMKPRLGTAKVGLSITRCRNAVQWWRQTERNWSDYIPELIVRNGITDNVLNPRKRCLISSSLILLVVFFFATVDTEFLPTHVKGWMSGECQGCQQFVTR